MWLRDKRATYSFRRHISSHAMSTGHWVNAMLAVPAIEQNPSRKIASSI